MIVEKLELFNTFQYFETFCNDPLIARISIDLKILLHYFILHYESHSHFQIAKVNRFEIVEAQSKNRKKQRCSISILLTLFSIKKAIFIFK